MLYTIKNHLRADSGVDLEYALQKMGRLLMIQILEIFFLKDSKAMSTEDWL